MFLLWHFNFHCISEAQTQLKKLTKLPLLSLSNQWFYPEIASFNSWGWPWLCVWAGWGCSCPSSWCILTRRCWGGGLSATGTPAAGLSRRSPGWRWWQPWLHRHPRASRSCPLRQRSVESCQGSSWPVGEKKTQKRSMSECMWAKTEIL